jgi:hypothetical protein
MCHVDILGTHIVSAWSSLENRVLQYLNRLLHQIRFVRVPCHVLWVDKRSCILHVTDEFGIHA